MGKLFCIPGQDSVWERSNAATRLFLDHVRALEAHLGVPSGLTPTDYDEVHIDVAVLQHFVEQAALLVDGTPTGLVRGLVETTVLYLCGLLARAAPSVRPSISDELLERSMATMKVEPF